MNELKCLIKNKISLVFDQCSTTSQKYRKLLFNKKILKKAN